MSYKSRNNWSMGICFDKCECQSCKRAKKDKEAKEKGKDCSQKKNN